MRAPRRLMLLFVACAALAGAIVQSGSAATASTADRLAELRGKRCPDSNFTCVTITVPLDHFDATDQRTIEVVFAVLPATGKRKGMFVTATGGPGTAGLASADSYTAAFQAGIRRRFDIVFFDQRGVASSGGLTCPAAAAAYYQSVEEPQDAARRFASDCVDQLRSTEELPYLGTAQAVEDLEDFRGLIGDDRLWLYGESYGTQYAQTYAAAHPQHLGLLLDGTVDLTLTGTEFLAEQAKAFNDVLVMTQGACSRQPQCKRQSAGDPLGAYDRLAARLAENPIAFRFPLRSGRGVTRSFTLPDLETVASGQVYSVGDRMLLQRALAASTRGDLVPLARLLYADLVIDPETLVAIPDPSYSDAMYYGVECQDYGYFSGTPEERAEAYLAAGEQAIPSIPRLGSIFYGDLPCVYWPDSIQDSARPAPLQAEGIPTIVLGATADPATPVGNGISVYGRLADGYLVTTKGGPHVIFGRGDPCPDDLVTAFLVDGTLPSRRETTCPGRVSSPYVSIAPAAASRFASVRAAFASALAEIDYLPEYYYWDGVGTSGAGCPAAGSIRFSGDRFTFRHCAFSRGFSMTGRGTYDYDRDRFVLDVRATGRWRGAYRVVRSGSTVVVSPAENPSQNARVTTMDVTDASFQVDVIERSAEVPVVVDFWADWCEPCKALAPVLEREVAERSEDMVLAKVDIDANPAVAGTYGIRSIPAVKAFRNGQVVSEFVGSLSPQAVTAFLDELTGPSKAERLVDELSASGEFPEILGPLAEGDYERALEWLLAAAADGDPERRERVREIMVAIFQELGQDHPLSTGYRRRLATALY